MKKRLLSLLLALALLLSVLPQLTLPTRAENQYSGSCGNNLTWIYDPDTGLLTISGSGSMYDYYDEDNFNNHSPTPWWYRTIKEVSVQEGVTRIGSGAFYGQKALVAVSLPESLECIGAHAFSFCESIKTIDFPENLTTIEEYAFSLCTGLTTVTLPNRLHTLGSSAFKGCKGLTSFTLSESLSTLGNYVFSGCVGLTAVSLPENIVSVESYAFENCSELRSVHFPASLESIGQEVFRDCGSLTSFTVAENSRSFSSIDGVLFNQDQTELVLYPKGKVGSYDIPNGVIRLQKEAFWDCAGLSSLSIPDTLRDFSRINVQNCSTLTQYIVSSGNPYFSNDDSGVLFSKDKTKLLQYPQAKTGDYEIPEGVLEIGSKAFYACEKLGSISFPASLCAIGERAFSQSIGLSSITLPDGLTEIGKYAFSQCKSLSSVILPENLTLIAEGTFRFCSALTSVRFPQGLTEIGPDAFSSCNNLLSADLPEGLKTIGKEAFSGCKSMNVVHIPESLQSTGSGIFRECASLTQVELPDSLLNVGSHMFIDCSGLCSVQLPAGIKSIPALMFGGCSSLKEIELPKKIETIHYGAFKDCKSLEKIEFPEGLKEIRDYALQGCTGLKSIAFPRTLNVIAAYAFQNCVNLNSVVLPEWLSELGDGAFAGVSECEFTVLSPSAQLSVGLPKTAKTIYGYDESTAEAFARKNNIPFVSLGKADHGYCGAEQTNLRWTLDQENGVLNIEGSGAMQNFDANQHGPWYGFKDLIRKVNLPENLSTIGEYAFYDCANIQSVTVPKNVTFVGCLAFTNCDGLKQVVFQGDGAYIETMRPHLDEFGEQDTPEDLMETERGENMLGPNTQVVVYGCSTGINGDVQESDWEPIHRNMCPRYYAEQAGYTFIALDAFGDVKPTAYYAVPVAWAVTNGITSGTGDGSFSPKKVCTREQVVSFLWKAAGSPEPEATSSPFPDVKPSKYYFKPVLWALERGITSGQSDGRFGVGKACTREQVVSFLWKAIGSPEPEGTESPFTDVKPGKYYFKPVLWAVENGVTSGASATTFGVGKSCTRAQIVTFLYNVYGK